jgi:hypothetical protein
VESCFGDEFVKRVSAEDEKGGEAGSGGRVRCACAAHDYRKDVDFGTRPVVSKGVGEGVYSSRISCAV